MGNTGKLLWVACFAALGVSACRAATPPASLMESGPVTAADYDRILETWTRSQKVYDGLDSILFVHATFHSPPFRRAFLLRHPEVYGPGSEIASRLLLTRPEAEQELEFFISATTYDRSWNDFDAPDSIWRVTLEGHDTEKVDGRIHRVKTTANLRIIYPYISNFARTYSARFPLTTITGDPVVSARSTGFVLRLTSALGEAELEWQLAPM